MKKFIVFSFLISSLLLTGCSTISSFISNEETTKNSQAQNDNVLVSEEDLQVLSHLDPNDREEIITDEEALPEDEEVDITSAMKSFNNNEEFAAIDAGSIDRMKMSIIEYLNTPYVFGGNSKKGIDCSAFTQTLYRNVFQYSLLRSARQQFSQGLIISDVDDLQFGDLVFFNTRKVKPGHVGIYIGNRLFAHASSRSGVIVSSIDHNYYSQKFMGGRRINMVAFK